MNNIDSGQVWYYYDVPETKEKTPRQCPVSQIPLLNGVAGEMPEKPAPRRGGEGINSKYIELARAGGRKDLLLYGENKKNEEIQAYSRVDWFDHPDTKPDSNVGRARVRPLPLKKSSKKHASMLTDDAPFNTDQFLVWNQNDEDDRDQYLTRQAQKQKALNKLKIPPLPLPVPEPQSPLKRTDKPPLGEKPDPVSFSHLLSHGYQADWSKNMTETRKQKMQMKRKDEREQKEKLTAHLNSYKKDHVGVPDKPLFKMKKFANAAPKIINS